MKSKDLEAMQVNQKLIELLSPQGLKIKRDTIETSDKISKMYYISSYPENPGIGWLSSLNTIPNTEFTVYVLPADSQALLDGLKKGTNSDRNIINTTRDDVERIRAQARYESAIRIIQDIENNNNAYMYVSILAEVYRI